MCHSYYDLFIQFIPITNIDYTIYNVSYFIVYSLEYTDKI